nr:hypothetical protein GCM10025732_55430 [Glycomyces mayteni]
MAVDDRVPGEEPEPGDLRVEPQVDVDGVGAGAQQHGVPLAPELVGAHLVGDRVDRALDLGGRGRLVEDEGVRAEVGVVGVGGREDVGVLAARARRLRLCAGDGAPGADARGDGRRGRAAECCSALEAAVLRWGLFLHVGLQRGSRGRNGGIAAGLIWESALP